MNRAGFINRFGAACVLAAALLPLGAAAQQDRTAERNARRMQLQVQTLQQQLQEVQAAKAKVDADRVALEQRLADQAADLARAQSGQRKAADSAKAIDSSRAALVETVAELRTKLAEQQHSDAEALAAKTLELAKSVEAAKARELERSQLEGRNLEQVRQLAECSVKNERLVAIGAELLDRYRRKGVGAALKQREPLFGFSDVEMFNLVQEYRDKIDVERLQPAQKR